MHPDLVRVIFWSCVIFVIGFHLTGERKSHGDGWRRMRALEPFKGKGFCFRAEVVGQGQITG
ncbi:hypothetical protein BDV40DRAFT_276017 [Aspergillus tamarii]|uniref:Uncharacterized protein n=1 Tax=Aspergillus tamarii TaxID=41984 RepID=A0A5N6UIQ3_ASPTM|nr:hypothetical protein BDV40DRAFT_276017 [Aspergillus tamarii]